MPAISNDASLMLFLELRVALLAIIFFEKINSAKKDGLNQIR